jgi:predicted DNA-binding protein (MmcQ/YjbR family)
MVQFFFTIIDKLNNSKFNATASFRFQNDKKFEYKLEDYKVKMYALNYEGDKSIKISLRYADNLIDTIARLKYEEDKKALMD